MVLVHRLVVDIVQVGLAVVRIIAVVHIGPAEEMKVDYHILRKNVYPEHFVCHMHYRRQAQQRRTVLQEHSCFVHNEYKTRYLLALLVGKLDKDVW